jgi:hypothetical protein
VDGRYAFETPQWALSLGGGASIVLLRPGSDDPPPAQPTGPPASAGRFVGGVDELNATGWGLDVPVIAGWRSTGQIVQIWFGARAGLERVSGDLPVVPNGMVPLGDPGSEADAHVTADGWFAGGLVGLAVGLAPVWVALEIDAAYRSLSASVDFPDAAMPETREAEAAGLTVAPTGAIIGKF